MTEIKYSCRDDHHHRDVVHGRDYERRDVVHGGGGVRDASNRDRGLGVCDALNRGGGRDAMNRDGGGGGATK